MGAWLRDLRPGRDDDYQHVLATRSELRTAPPCWEDITLDLLACPSTDGGTGAPLGYQYQLAPDFIARRIPDLAAATGNGAAAPPAGREPRGRRGDLARWRRWPRGRLAAGLAGLAAG